MSRDQPLDVADLELLVAARQRETVGKQRRNFAEEKAITPFPMATMSFRRSYCKAEIRELPG